MPAHVEFSVADVVSALVQPATVLSNGRYTVVFTASGTGYSAFDGLALTRWFPDRTHDASGAIVYVRDEETGTFGSVGLSPANSEPDRYAAKFSAGRADLTRADGDIETRVTVCVAPDADAELRRITIVNNGSSVRTLSVTVYAEAVLNDPIADAGHPAFSKLFVQTQTTAGDDGLVAKRRLRGASDEPLYVVSTLTGAGLVAGVESDRARFIGRGRTLAAPLAMRPGEQLSGSTGNVLDPVFAIRRTVTIAPHATAEMIWVTAAGKAQAETERAAAAIVEGGDSVIDRIFSAASRRAADLFGDEMQDGLIFRAIGAAIYGTPVSPPRLRGKGAVDTDIGIISEARAMIAAGDRSFTRVVAANGSNVRSSSSSVTAPRDDTGVQHGDDLQFFNGYGGFSADGKEYVIRPRSTPDGMVLPPQPWVNVIANPRIGFIASERGAGFTWSENSRLNRLTPWSNDPVMDPNGEALYVRDVATGDVWSPMPGPIPGDGRYEVRHGFGYTSYTHATETLSEETTAFVPPSDPVKLTRLRITNTGSSARSLNVFSYAQLVLGAAPWETAAHVKTNVIGNVIRATNADAGTFASRVAFATAIPSNRGDTVLSCADRRRFIGVRGSVEQPDVVVSGESLHASGTDSGDHCAAFQLDVTLEPGATWECTIALGEGTTSGEVDALIAKYRGEGAVDDALREAWGFWEDLLGGVRIKTPSRAIDLMVNGWLAYQNLSCRIWGRSALYQSGGAFGFRDQLQDAAALIDLAPDRTRDQILIHASHQFVEGDVLHWWHPPSSEGIRTHFSDDLLWLPYVTAYYIGTTGDTGILDEIVPFVTGPELDADDDEIFIHPETGVGGASLYEHCCRVLDRSLTRGAHGLPLMGTGDWNDGMNRVGREGKGESVWLGFFLSRIIDAFAPFCASRGDTVHAGRYAHYNEALKIALNDAGWDGAWYRRAYYDDGTPLGTASGDECRIDAIAQAWAVISGVAPPDRATQAMDAMEENLVSERDGIIRLLTPPFDKTIHDPGYIKGYLPGVRENGGQYTHAALWAVKALAEVGRTERAATLLEMLSPVTRGGSAEAIARYQAEPYVVAADVYGVAPHIGRGGWTWYTGSAGWMYRVAIESVLGIEIEDGDAITVRPCIPDDWPGFTVRYRLPGEDTTYELVVTRANAGDPTSATLDGIADGVTVVRGVTRVSIARDGRDHRVSILIGVDVEARYSARLVSA